MKKGIHPDYKPAMIKCVCGNTLETRSTRGDYEVQICSNCGHTHEGDASDKCPVCGVPKSRYREFAA